jgi:diguanylate cyclase (GGDEF)-like protein/PAS domain S-box-containing protein
MPMPPQILDEEARLESLKSYEVMDSEAEASFDDLVQLASQVCGTPIGWVALLDRERQWFKSKLGWNATGTPRDVSFCAHAIARKDPLIISDLSKDERFADSPLVTGEPYARFYAGVPLEAPGGHNLGTLCVLDRVPRTLTPHQEKSLRTLAREVMAHLELRKKTRMLDTALVDIRHASESLSSSEARFRAFMDSSPAIAFMKTPDGKLVYYNKPFADTFKITLEEWKGKDDFERFPEAYARDLRKHDLEVLASDKPSVLEEMTPTPVGGFCCWRSYKFPFVDTTGTKYIAGLALDVTREKAVEVFVRQGEERLRDLLDSMQEMVQSIDPNGRLMYVNRAWKDRLGYSDAEIMNMKFLEVVHPAERGRIATLVERAVRGENFKDLPLKLITKSGGTVSVEADVAWRFDDGKAIASRAIFHDVTDRLERESQIAAYQLELQKANEQLQQLASTDELTGLKNRRAFQEKFEDSFNLSRRHLWPLALLIIDVDEFKSFNDTFGHLAGDQALKAIASRLLKTARSTDFVCRFGGEEFAVILTNTSLYGGTVVAERFRAAVMDEKWDKRSLTISVGVSARTSTMNGPEDLIQAADEALYRAKNTGRNRVVTTGSIPTL